MGETEAFLLLLVTAAASDPDEHTLSARIEKHHIVIHQVLLVELVNFSHVEATCCSGHVKQTGYNILPTLTSRVKARILLLPALQR